MAVVLDVNNYLLLRDINDELFVCIFEGGIITRKIKEIKKDSAKIYFQCDGDTTFVGNNHPSFYSLPMDMTEHFNEVRTYRNFQIIPWERI